MERPGTEVPALEADPPGKIGNEAVKATDHKLSTFYTSKGNASPGYLNVKLTETEHSEVIVLQNPTAISNAEVSVRDTDGWHQVGALSQSYNVIDASLYEHVLEVKLEWDGSVELQIHEIIPVKREKVETPTAGSAAEMKNQVEHLEKAGQFTGHDTSHSLKLHLTAVSHYEERELADKVVKHMESFKLLLDHQRENGLIAEEAYHTLKASTHYLIEKWQKS